MRLIPIGEKVRLCDLEPGLFLFDDCLALKTEYITESGRIEAYIVDTGEFFHGGTKTAADQRNLMVQPLKVEPLVLTAADFCSYGKQNDFPKITEQTQAALEAMGKKAHGGNDDD